MANIFFNPRYIASVWRAGDIPAMPAPIVAFAGRSNAGKSSLINALCNAKTAKVSKAPGKTRMINIFQIQSRLLADMPGYGYAKVPVAEKRAWQTKMRGFLPDIGALVLVVDCRRGIGVLDSGMISAIGKEGGRLTAVIIALTKADKLSRAKLLAAESRAREVIADVVLPNVHVLPVSSHTGANIATLRAIVTKETAL
ncbi:MAG: ribosome biogenesis GTP-binding protein YihA/YsxC [Gammaproteobacteria bacterium]